MDMDYDRFRWLGRTDVIIWAYKGDGIDTKLVNNS